MNIISLNSLDEDARINLSDYLYREYLLYKAELIDKNESDIKEILTGYIWDNINTLEDLE